jgi:hypothetical protein
MAEPIDHNENQLEEAQSAKENATKKAGAVNKPSVKNPTTKAAKQAGTPPKGGWPKKRTFPSVTLEEALKVARAVRFKYGGNPMPTELVATACDTTHKTDKFFYLTSAAQNYGLTVGSRTSAQIELTPLGRALAYATSPAEEQEKKVEAFFMVEKFKQVYDYYNGSGNLPEKQYLSNALENQFQLPPDEHDEFTEVFKANCKYLGIEDGLKARQTRSDNRDTKAIDVRSMGKPSRWASQRETSSGSRLSPCPLVRREFRSVPPVFLTKC